MAEGLEIVKTFAPVAAPLTAAIVETWVKPKLQKLHKYLKMDKALFENALSTKFDDYLQRAYTRNSYINVIVFQNQQKKLEELYVPLTVIPAARKSQILIDDYKQEFIPKYKKVLIRDTAGMGKSTLMKFLFLCCVNLNEGIPIFIELRKLKSDDSVVSYIYNELNPVDDEFDKDFILKLIKEGGFIFFLDGYDEIPFSERDKVTSNLQDFISKASNNFFILSSRPESSLASFTDFNEFTIKPLSLDESFILLNKYDNGGVLSKELTAKLSSDEYQDIHEFLTNPLLVSLIYKSYEYKHTIPLKKPIFYRQVYDALFESHDLTKSGAYVREKHSGLDVEEFHRVIRNLGFISVKLGQIEFDKDTLISLLQRAKANCYDLQFKESDVFKDLLTTVPLFNKDGNYYRWTHKAIQEYFAAQFIWLDTKGNQGKVLRQMVRSENNNRFFNVLDIYSDIDYKTFEQSVAYDCICDFINYFDSSYSLLNQDEIGEINIRDRKVLTFNRIIIFAKPELKQDASTYKDLLARIASEYSHSNNLFQDFKISETFNSSLTILMGHHEPVATILSKKYTKNPIVIEWDLYRKLTGYLKLSRPDHYDRHVIQERQLVDNKFKAIIDSGQDYLILTDNPNEFYNQKQYFEGANLTLYGQSPALSAYLDIDKCRELKHKIEEDIAKELSDNFIFDGI